MVSCARAKSEFLKWVKSLNTDDLSEYECKLINIILDDFETIASLGTGYGQRAKKLARLINAKRNTVSKTIDIQAHDDHEDVEHVTRLTSLEVGPFRGFFDSVTFPFDKDYTFVYGPNGSGKSSFCQALEYGLLGEIHEAHSIRFDSSDYAKNAMTGQLELPVLKGKNHQGDDIPISADDSFYRFCFIEKNRIESFARISATTQGEQSSRIASLFGLDEFDDFVKKFTDKFEDYIDVVGEKRLQYIMASDAIRHHIDFLKAHSKTLANLNSRKNALAKDSALELPFDEISTYLNGPDQADSDALDDQAPTGRLKALDSLLEEQVGASLSVLSVVEVEALLNELQRLLNDYVSSTHDYDAQKEQFSFKSLYTSLTNIKQYSTEDICPACLTPLDRVVVNPFQHAQDKLEKLGALAAMEVAIEERRQKVINRYNSTLKTFIELNKQFSVVKLELELNVSSHEELVQTSDAGDIVLCVEGLIKTIREEDHTLAQLRDAVKTHNASIESQTNTNAAYSDERTRLRALNTQVAVLLGETKTLASGKAEAEEQIKVFETAQDDLIKAVAKEAVVVADNKKFEEAYRSFLAKLKHYRDMLPLQLVKDLDQRTLELYNLININDQDYDKINYLHLPISPSEPIRLRFAGEPEDTYHNALHVLSEGHIRCLGLAILLAKSIQEKHRIIVFDDVVNAIDDEHRSSIANLLLQNPLLSDRQIILTTHGNEFRKTLENTLTPDELNTRVSVILFESPTDQRGIQAQYDAASRNYLEKASRDYDDHNDRDCLAECRRALENISNRLWVWLANRYKVMFKVGMRHPKAKPELSAVIDGLITQFNKGHMPPEFKTASNILKYLKQEVIWSELNKGIHEEEEHEEFDTIIVKEILEKMLELDKFAKSPLTQNTAPGA